MSSTQIEIVAYRPEYGLELVKLWRRSFQHAMGLEAQNRFDDLTGQLDFFCTLPAETIQVAMDVSNSSLAGFMVLRESELEQLYIDINYQGAGLGSMFLNRAKSQSPTGLTLHTFLQNTRAQAFYLANGFIEVGRGYADAASNPWATSRSQLADITFQWLPEKS